MNAVLTAPLVRNSNPQFGYPSDAKTVTLLKVTEPKYGKVYYVAREDLERARSQARPGVALRSATGEKLARSVPDNYSGPVVMHLSFIEGARVDVLRR